jgi:hypothetical protein
MAHASIGEAMTTNQTIDGEARNALEQALLAMKRIYQAGYDRIVDAGGTCDTPEYMMQHDPTARELRALLDAPVCKICDGLGHVPDGEIYGSGGVEFENGPVECVKDCPACKPAAKPQGGPILIQAVAITRQNDDGIYLEWLLEGGISEMEFPGQVLFAMPEANDLCDEDGSAEIYIRPAEQPAPVAVVPKSECPNCLGDSMFRCDACIPDFSPGNGNRARRRAESLGLTIPVAPTPYDGFDNGVD